jgi:putative FmdB family regulatory protein
MPLYEYECETCGARFEVIQRFSDPAVDACRTCGGPVHKLISAPAIQFKGTGWYITDYAKKNGSGPPAEPSSSSAPAGDGKSDSSSSSKPASSTSSSSGSSSSGSGSSSDSSSSDSRSSDSRSSDSRSSDSRSSDSGKKS